MRLSLRILAVAAGVVFLLLAGVFALLPRLDLAGYAAARATAALGRSVTIERLHVTPGLNLSVELRGVSLANIEGGTRAEMVTLRAATAEVALLPLLRGRLELPRLRIEGLDVLLERAPGRIANWHFGDRPRPPPPPEPVTAEVTPPPERARFPILLDAHIADSVIVFRTTGGAMLTTKLDDLSLGAPSAGEPVAMRGTGSYNAVPIVLDAELGSFQALHDLSTPYPMEFTATSGEVRLAFRGTAVDPVNFDGLWGQATLDAPTIAPILTMAGAEGEVPDIAVTIDGHFIRHTDLWRLTDVQGSLAGSPMSAPLIELTEGPVGQSNRLALDIAVDRLDLNRLLAPHGADGPEADLPLIVADNPDPLTRAKILVGEIVYAGIRAQDLSFEAEVSPRLIAIRNATAIAFGSHLAGTVRATPAPDGAQFDASVRLTDGNLDTLRRAFGLTALPVSGQVEARIVATAQGTRLNGATRSARVSAVVSMRQGRVAREVIEMASTDIRALFRTARGTTPVSCMLAVVDIRDSRGDAAPLRIRSAEGTIGGVARFDLSRETLDLVIGSERATTNFLALDIPVRVSGSFANPSIAPASWSREGRAQLAEADSRIAPLPSELRQFAQSNPCIRRTTRR